MNLPSCCLVLKTASPTLNLSCENPTDPRISRLLVFRRRAVLFHVAASESWSAASSLRRTPPSPLRAVFSAAAPGGAGTHLGLCSQLLLRGLVGTGMGWASPCQSKFHPALDLPGLLGEEGWTVRAVWGLRQRTCPKGFHSLGTQGRAATPMISL